MSVVSAAGVLMSLFDQNFVSLCEDGIYISSVNSKYVTFLEYICIWFTLSWHVGKVSATHCSCSHKIGTPISPQQVRELPLFTTRASWGVLNYYIISVILGWPAVCKKQRCLHTSSIALKLTNHYVAWCSLLDYRRLRWLDDILCRL